MRSDPEHAGPVPEQAAPAVDQRDRRHPRRVRPCRGGNGGRALTPCPARGCLSVLGQREDRRGGGQTPGASRGTLSIVAPTLPLAKRNSQFRSRARRPGPRAEPRLRSLFRLRDDEAHAQRRIEQLLDASRRTGEDGSDPEDSIAGLDQRGDGSRRQAVGRAEVSEPVTVEAREAVSGSQPEEAMRVGEDACDAVAGLPRRSCRS